MQPNEEEQVIPYRHGILSTTANVAAGSAGGAVKGGLWGGLAGAATGTLGILAVPFIAVGVIALAALAVTMVGAAIYAAFSYSAAAGVATLVGMGALSAVGAATAVGSTIFGPVGAAIGSVIGFFKGGADSFSRTQQETAAAHMVDSQLEAMQAQASALQAQAQLQGARFAGQFAPVGPTNAPAPRINVGAENAQHNGAVVDMARYIAADKAKKAEGTPVVGAATEKLAADRELREQAVQSV
jgi:hypothetical protein